MLPVKMFPAPPSGGKNREAVNRKGLLVSLADELSGSEVRHLIFLCKGVVLPREVAEKIQTFPELVETLIEHKKIGPQAKDMKDWQVLFDILELIKRKDIVKRLKCYGKKYSEQDNTGKHGPNSSILVAGLPFISVDGTGEPMEMSADSVSLKKLLQKGDYSDIWRGSASAKGDVMVEVYKKTRSSDMQPSFASQGDIQSRLKHANIIEVLKVLRNKDPPWIVLEWMPNGSLLTFVRTQNWTSAQLIGFAAQIAKGMCFLEEKRYAHCNLRASNIFLSQNNTVKIGGFCLAVKLRDGNLSELQEDVLLPMRWSALELILYRQATDKSDIWSFGIVVVEMFSKGELPYQGMEIKELVTILRQGERHPQPDDCPDGLYRMVKTCWHMPDETRPSFKELLPFLENYREDNKPYREDNKPPRPFVGPSKSAPVRPRCRNSGVPKTLERSATMLAKRNSYLRYIGGESGDQPPPPAHFPEELQRRPKSQFPVSWSKELEMPRNSLNLVQMIGTGEFGEVWKAELPTSEEVAVKMFIPTRMESKQFLAEAEMMRRFNHPHLVSLIGVCSESPPIYIVSELMQLGSLREYLRNDAGKTLLTTHLLDYAAQVADAMCCMEAMNCIHRDIAARNVFMRDKSTVKLGDFGLSRTIISSYYQASGDIRCPARWTAPEAVQTRCFSIKSDVWSFGVFLIELVTYGETPYPDMSNEEAISMVRKGYKHPQPVDTCPDDVYEVMISCWRIKADKRPSFQELFNTVKGLRENYKT